MIVTGRAVVTGDPDQPVVADGAVLVRGDTVDAVGPAAALRATHPAEPVTDTGLVLLPGLVNLHTHAYSAYARGMAVHSPTRSFDEILENLWWRLDRLLEPEDVRLNATTTFLESVRCGVTTVFDHHSSPGAVSGSLRTIADAADEVGLRACLCYETSDRDGEDVFAEAVAENTTFMRESNTTEQHRLRGMFGLHASFTLIDASLDTVAAAAYGLPGGYHVHVAEGPGDQRWTMATDGLRVVHRLDARGMLGPDGIAAHCVHVDDGEIEVLAARGATVAHNPHSNLGNAVGFAPVVEMLRHGVRVGLGTDAYTADMIASMQVAKLVASGSRLDPTVGFGEAVTMLFTNNPAVASHVFGRDVGILRRGAVADVVALDYRPPTALDDRSAWGHVVYGMSGAQVVDVMVGGQWVLRNREFVSVDEARALARSAERAERVWKEL